MQFNRIRLSEDSRIKLGILKARTGLLPNVLCRIGLMLSLTDPSEPEFDADATDGSEFNRFTLTGEWDPLIVALLEERAITKGLCVDNEELGADREELDNEEFVKYFRAHLNRGVRMLHGRVRGLEDLANFLMPVP